MKRILIVVMAVALLLPAVLALTVPSAAAAAGVPHWFVRQGEFTPDGVYDEASESALLTQPLNAERTVMAGGVWDLTCLFAFFRQGIKKAKRPRGRSK